MSPQGLSKLEKFEKLVGKNCTVVIHTVSLTVRRTNKLQLGDFFLNFIMQLGPVIIITALKI